MSSLSKITITKIKTPKYYLKIESIHPNAPSLAWINLQTEKTIKLNLLFRTLLVIENIQAEDEENSSLFKDIYKRLIPKIADEYGEAKPLSKFSEITEFGSDFLIEIIDEIIVSVKIIEQDINDNWENGLITNFNPYKIDNIGVPFVIFEIELKNGSIEDKYAGKPTYSSTGITCKDK
jgi:hypothetical protein